MRQCGLSVDVEMLAALDDRELLRLLRPRTGGSRQAGLAMIFKLIETAEGRCARKLTGAHLVALVRAGAEFKNEKLVEEYEEKCPA